MGAFFVFLILSLPLYVLYFWNYSYPEEALLREERGKYKEEPEFTESAIRSVKKYSLIAMAAHTLILIIWFLDLLG